jgi:putative spermidine/putrescine transport system permease protein
MLPSTGKARQRRHFLLPFVLPGILLAAAQLVALAAILVYSFREFIPGSIRVGGFTFANFARLVNPVYLEVYFDTVVLSFIAAVMTAVLCLPIAYTLVRTRSRALQGFLILVAIMPLFTGDVARTYAWMVMLGESGFVNTMFRWLGLVREPLEMLYTRAAVVVVMGQYAMPVMTVILVTAIGHISRDMERAAATLGASPLTVLLRVVLPLASPGLISGLVLVFAWNFSAFATPQLIGGGRIMMISNLVYQQGYQSFDFPLGATLSVLALVVAVTIVEVSRRYTRRFDAHALM